MSATGVPSRVIFPLRSSVELQRQPAALGPAARIKQAAVLYDEVIVEMGVFEVTISDRFSQSLWHPPSSASIDGATGEHLEGPGTSVSLGFARQAQPGVPADAPEFILEGAAIRHYRSQFHSSVLNELERLDPDWLQLVPTASGKLPTDLQREEASLNFEDRRSADEILPDLSSFERSFVIEAFNRDALVASALEAAIGVTPMFIPMALRRGLTPVQNSGQHAVRLATRDLAQVPWEQIIEFREHAGAQEARAKLREFERLASVEGPDDAAEYLRSVSNQISHAYLATIRENRPRLADAIADQVMGSIVSTVPMVGPALSSLLAVFRAGATDRRFASSWTAALMTLDGNSG